MYKSRAINSGVGILCGPVKCVRHRLPGYEAFNAGDNHKFTAFLNAFSPPYFLGEDFWLLQVLLDSSFEAVALREDLVFNNYRRHSRSFKFRDCVFDGVCVSPSIAVDDHGLVSSHENFVDCMKPGVKGNDFAVGVAFGG